MRSTNEPIRLLHWHRTKSRLRYLFDGRWSTNVQSSAFAWTTREQCAYVEFIQFICLFLTVQGMKSMNGFNLTAIEQISSSIESIEWSIQSCLFPIKSNLQLHPIYNVYLNWTVVYIECFFRAIDMTRFFKSIVRDSLTVRSVGECEMECIKTTKFTCRAFSFRWLSIFGVLIFTILELSIAQNLNSHYLEFN